MPMGDGTGPNGMGPMTGRGRGFCAGFNFPGFMNPGFGRGFGRGRGFGFRAGFYPQVTQSQVITEADDNENLRNSQAPAFDKTSEKKILQEDLEILKQEMSEIQRRLKELK